MTPDPDKPINIVIFAGGDNADGFGLRASDLPERYQKAVPNSFIWQKGAWQPLIPGSGYQAPGEYGPEVSFAMSFAPAFGGPLGIVKLAVKGSNLADDWAEGNDQGLCVKLVEQTRAAMWQGPHRLCGLVWLQGEADAESRYKAKRYGKYFGRFVDHFRASIGATGLPVLAGTVPQPTKATKKLQMVRDGIKNTGLLGVHLLETEDLPLKEDGLTFSKRGNSRLGRRVAKRLALEDRPALYREPLWISDQYEVFYEGNSQDPSQILVTFPYAGKGDGFRVAPFTQTFANKKGIDAVYVRCQTSNWFQDQEIPLIAQKIKSRFGPDAEFVTYGASMGAYGALLTSGVLKPKRVLAAAPQYSIDRKIIKDEVRWASAAKRIGRFRFDVGQAADPDAQKIILFDPYCPDKPQIAAFPDDAGWQKVRIPYAGHSILRYLQRAGTLGLLMEDIFGDGPDIANLQAETFANRRNLPLFWFTIAETQFKRRPKVAKFAVDQAERLGAPRKRVRIWREKFESAAKKLVEFS